MCTVKWITSDVNNVKGEMFTAFNSLTEFIGSAINL